MNDDSDKAKALNVFFKSIFTEESDCLSGFKLNVNKLPGADELHPMILKECSNEFSLLVSLISSNSYSEGELPQDWKDAIFTL